MSGVIWKTPSGETGPEVSRQRINGEIVVEIHIPQPAHLNDWHARRVHVPLSKPEEVPNDQTRYGGARGGAGMNITAQIPVRLVNGANAREHWAARAKRAKAQRNAAWVAMMSARPGSMWKMAEGDHVAITITRRGGRRMDDDGLTISAKHVRDGIADWLGIDDGDKRLTWVVKQDKAPRGQHWVDVQVSLAGVSVDGVK